MTSVLFGDLVGFTSLSESRDQEEVREILSAYFEECRVIIDRYGGTVEKFIGDAVMAVWGVPVAHEDDAERAVRAGLELVDAVAALGDRVGVQGLAMRVGITTGEVAVTVGARGQGMVAGDPVNTAARVQSSAPPAQVWVDETTRTLSQAAVSFTDVGSHRLKGKEHPVQLWQAQAVVAGIGGDQRADGLEPPLIERERELRVVKEVFHRTEETRSPTLMLVSAGPGLGKTRLGWEFSKYIDGLTDAVRWLEGRCPAYGGGSAYHALAEAFRGRLRSLDPTGPGDLAALLDDLLEMHVTDPDERPWLRARLATLLSLPGAQSYPREELFAAWVTVLQHLGADSAAIVLLVDDAQYADEGLIDFIEFALTAEDLPLLVVLLTRPELLTARPELATNPNVVTAHLRELSEVGMSRVVSALVAGLPEPAVQALVERSSGVPLFAVETIRSLIDRQLVVADGDTYVLADPAADLTTVDAPISLQALIASRLDALPPELRVVVELGSVLGSFSAEMLGRLTGGGTPDVADRLAALVRRQLLTLGSSRLSGELGAYTFTQDVVRQVAYSMLARRDRRAFHLRVVALLEQDGLESGLPMLAHHLSSAVEAMPGAEDADELRIRARDAFEAAGDWAQRLSSWTDAAAHYGRAAELAGDDVARRASLLCRLAEVYINDDPDGGLAAGREAIDAYRSVGDETGEAHASGITAMLLYVRGDVAESHRLVEPYWEAFKGRHDADATVAVLARAKAASNRLHGQDIREAADVTLAVAQRSGDPEILLRGLGMLAQSYHERGLVEVTRAVLTGALPLARAHDLKQSESNLLSNLAGTVEGSIDLRAAVQTARQALALSKELRMRDSISVNATNLMLFLYDRGEWNEVDELLASEFPTMRRQFRAHGEALASLMGAGRGTPTQTTDPTATADDPDSLIFSRVMSGVLRLRSGQRAGVGEELVRIVRETVEHGSLRDLDETLLAALVEALLDLGERDLLAQLLDLTAAQLAEHPSPLGAGLLTRLRAHLALLDGGPSEAVVAGLRTAIGHFDAFGGTLYVRRTQAELATVLAGLGEVQEAGDLRIQVREFYESLGARAWLRELDHAGEPRVCVEYLTQEEGVRHGLLVSTI